MVEGTITNQCLMFCSMNTDPSILYGHFNTLYFKSGPPRHTFKCHEDLQIHFYRNRKDRNIMYMLKEWRALKIFLSIFHET